MAPKGGKEVSPSNLTESNLTLHNTVEESGKPDGSVMSWMAKVIVEEQIHRYHSQLGVKCSNLQNQDSIDIEQVMDQLGQAASGSNTDQMSGSLKLFEQQHRGTYRETPLERFLTPDGCSDLSYFARPALAQMGTDFGDMEAQEKRRAKAKENVESVASNKRQKGIKKTK
ncbi:hypothetical protein BBP40_002488 [Aspergillus hancockii]|nr:hypothetical protein BBP40_002488 [Aspergillus hancockii]